MEYYGSNDFRDYEGLYLEHYGIMGMKWGVRRYQNEDGSYTAAGRKRYRVTSNNEHSTSIQKDKKEILKSKDGKISLQKQETRGIAKILSKISPEIAKEQDKNRGYDIFDKNGKIIGDFQVEDKKDHLYINWISISNKERGRGYASSALNTMLEDAKNRGYNKVRLEVPSISPDARHIYEKAGFKDVGKTLGDKDDIWGGLSTMELDFTKRK